MLQCDFSGNVGERILALLKTVTVDIEAMKAEERKLQSPDGKLVPQSCFSQTLNRLAQCVPSLHRPINGWVHIGFHHSRVKRISSNWLDTQLSSHFTLDSAIM